MEEKEVFREMEEKMKKAVEVVRHQFSNLRTNRPSPQILENVKVEYYGSLVPLKQLASISNPAPRLLVVQPWDVSTIDEIKKAIMRANLGFSPESDKKIIRITVPQLDAQRREEIVKVAHQIAEQGKAGVRAQRREANERIENLQREKKISEDDKFRDKERIQEITDRYIEQINELLKKKEEEIREI
ncbi:MAG: ribosome recycling factor [Candidatus Omnitrophota bacterium]|nr:MAG: ribosome recycling factor [Candidatus Omnitrophota bacterium]